MKGLGLWAAALVWLALSVSAAAAAQDRSGQFESAGLTLHYSIRGDGPPILLLSGGPGVDPGHMAPLADQLAAGHTVILLDQRGTGRSVPAPVDATTVSEHLLIEDIEALRHALGYRQWALLGHSFGSYTAMRYAIAHPDRVARLVLLAAMPPTDRSDRFLATLDKRLSPEGKARVEAIEAAWPKATPAEQDALMQEAAQLSLTAYFADPSKIAAFLAVASADAMHSDTARLLNAEAAGYDLRAGLAELVMPVLIVQGRQDPLDPAVAAETRDAIPGARLVILEDCGHFAWIEAPAALEKALRPFLDGP